MTALKIRCADCGADKPSPDADGYGEPGYTGAGFAHHTDDPETRYCLPCMGLRELAELAKTSTDAPYFAYLSSDGRSVTTWAGTELARVTYLNRSCSGFGGWRRDGGRTFIRAVDTFGRSWYGSGPGETGTYVRMRLTKPDRRSAIPAGVTLELADGKLYAVKALNHGAMAHVRLNMLGKAPAGAEIFLRKNHHTVEGGRVVTTIGASESVGNIAFGAYGYQTVIYSHGYPLTFPRAQLGAAMIYALSLLS